MIYLIYSYKEKKIGHLLHLLCFESIYNIKQLPQEFSTYGIVHGDLWLENILVDEDFKMTMIDFQDCEKHYYIHDLAVPIYSAMEYSFSGGENISDYGRSIASALLEGYKEENDISPEVIEKLPLFMNVLSLYADIGGRSYKP